MPRGQLETTFEGAEGGTVIREGDECYKQTWQHCVFGIDA